MTACNCVNCGAPVRGHVCEYCGTVHPRTKPDRDFIAVYADNEIIEVVDPDIGCCDPGISMEEFEDRLFSLASAAVISAAPIRADYIATGTIDLNQLDGGKEWETQHPKPEKYITKALPARSNGRAASFVPIRAVYQAWESIVKAAASILRKRNAEKRSR